MSEKKNDQKSNENACKNCGDTRTLLTEDVYAPPKCAGCGKNKA